MYLIFGVGPDLFFLAGCWIGMAGLSGMPCRIICFFLPDIRFPVDNPFFSCWISDIRPDNQTLPDIGPDKPALPDIRPNSIDLFYQLIHFSRGPISHAISFFPWVRPAKWFLFWTELRPLLNKVHEILHFFANFLR